MIYLLVELGAEINCQDNKGNTVLRNLVVNLPNTESTNPEFGNIINVIASILESSASLGTENKEGRTMQIIDHRLKETTSPGICIQFTAILIVLCVFAKSSEPVLKMN